MSKENNMTDRRHVSRGPTLIARIGIVFSIFLLEGFDVGLASEPSSPSETPQLQMVKPSRENRSPSPVRVLGDPLSPNPFQHLTISPNGKFAVFTEGPGDNTVYVRDLQTGKAHYEIRGHKYVVNQIAFSPDSRLLYTGGNAMGKIGGGDPFLGHLTSVPDKILHVWDLAAGKHVRQFPADYWSLAANGKILATAEVEVGYPEKPTPGSKPFIRGYRFKVWDSIKGKKLHEIDFHVNSIAGLCVSADGSVIVCGDSRNGFLQVCNGRTGKVERKMVVPEGFHQRLAISGAGKTLAVYAESSNKETTRGDLVLWDVQTGKKIRQLATWNGSNNDSNDFRSIEVHEAVLKSGIARMEFTPIGLRTLNNNNELHLWDVNSGNKTKTWKFAHDEDIAWAVIGNNESQQQAGKSKFLNYLRKRTTGDGYKEIAYKFDSATFSPDSKLLAVSGFGGRLHLWDVATGKLLKTMLDGDDIGHLVFSDNGRLLATAPWQGNKVSVWDAANGKKLAVFSLKAESQIFDLDFVPGTKQLRICSDNKRWWIWDWQAGKTTPLKGFPKQIERVDFVDDHRVLVRTKTVRLYDLRTKKTIWEITSVPENQGSGKFHPPFWSDLIWGRKLLITSGKENTQQLEPGERLAFIPPSYIPDFELRLWDVNTGRYLYLLPFELVNRCILSHDARSMAYWHEGKAGLLETATNKSRFDFPSKSCNLALSPDGRLLANLVASRIQIWDLTGQQIIGPMQPLLLTEQQSQKSWDDLQGSDAKAAYRAIWRLAASPQTVPFLQGKLQQMSFPSTKSIPKIIADLDSPRFAVREKAGKQLRRYACLALPEIRQTLLKKPTLETYQRLRRLQDQIEKTPLTRELIVLTRAAEILEIIGTPQAKRLLKEIPLR